MKYDGAGRETQVPSSAHKKKDQIDRFGPFFIRYSGLKTQNHRSDVYILFDKTYFKESA